MHKSTMKGNPEGAGRRRLPLWNVVSILVALTIVTSFFIKQEESLASPSVDEKEKNSTSSESDAVTGSHPNTFYNENQFWLPQQSQPTRYRFPRNRRLDEKIASDRPAIVVGILSAAAEPFRRTWVRDTWTRDQAHRTYFLVGGNWTDELAAEFELYRDLLWMDTPESYFRLTEKTTGFFAAIAQELDPSSYDYVLKTDDDSYVVLEDCIDQILVPDSQTMLAANATTQQQPHYFYTGAGCDRNPVHRNPESKWYVSEEAYAEERFPPYAMGQGYFLSRDLASCVVRQNYLLVDPTTMSPQEYEQRQLLPGMFPIEDAFTGLLVENCEGSCVQDNRRFGNWLRQNVVEEGRFEEWFKELSERKKYPPLYHGVKTQAEMERFHYDRCCNPVYGNSPLSICNAVQCTSSPPTIG